jgi:hypothetical protein
MGDDIKPVPPIQFLFRFRDLVGDPIREHQKVITENRSCGWGWWKRPDEDNRIAVWHELENQAAAEAPHLRNYSEDILARYNGKVIMAADELTSMDTTICLEGEGQGHSTMAEAITNAIDLNKNPIGLVLDVKGEFNFSTRQPKLSLSDWSVQ